MKIKTKVAPNWFVNCWVVVAILLFLVFGWIGLSANKLTQIKNQESRQDKWLTYKDDRYYFSFQYPEKSKIEKWEDKDIYTIEVKLPAENFTAETLFRVRVSTRDISKLAFEFSTKDPSYEKTGVAGVLPATIDGLLQKENYVLLCPELGNVCQKQSNYYEGPILSKRLHYLISTYHYTDSEGNQMRNKMLDKMVSTFKYSE